MEDRRLRQEPAAALFAELLSGQLKSNVRTAGRWLGSSQIPGHPEACLLDIDAEKALGLHTQTQNSLSKHPVAEVGALAFDTSGGGVNATQGPY